MTVLSPLMNAPGSRRSRALAEIDAARRDRRQQPRSVPARCLAALFPPAAARGAGPLLPGQARSGPFWSVTKHKDIIAVEVNHKAFSSSSALGGITLRDRPGELELPMFIAMDPPKHDVQRKVVQPIVSPENLGQFRGPDPRPRARNARRPAARRDVQLGRQGLDRAHLPDAGDPVRLPVRGPAQARATGRTSRPPFLIRAGWSKAKSSARRCSASASAIS